jgi:hypothetical protein
MDFRITGIDPALYRDYFALDDGALARRFAQRRTVEAKPGAPCRVSLEDAEPGEIVLLVNHEHLPVDSPYRSRHATWPKARRPRPSFGASSGGPARITCMCTSPGPDASRRASCARLRCPKMASSGAAAGR